MLVGQTIGKGDKAFHVEKELGSGAMGSVYRIRMVESGQVRALKMIAFGLVDNDSARQRFDREADILKQLKHPNIVRLYGTGHIQGTPFFLMEYIEGESMDKIMERRGKMPWEDVAGYGRQLCAALMHAHEKGIVHRDLKPSNLMLTKDGVLKLTDFGIAKDVDVTALTAANNTIGTAAYMSPEQCRGERTLGPKSDIYSLGVVFYELITGRKPFNKEAAVEMFLAHVHDPFDRPSQFVPDLPVWFDNLIVQMMEKSPEKRPMDAAMIGRALEEIEAKAAERKSVGAEVATARRVDKAKLRPTNKLDDADREAGEVIRASAKRKKAKKKKTPFYQHLWFGVAAGVAVLGLMAFTVYKIALEKPDPAIAYKMALGKKDDDARQQAFEDYLKMYPDGPDAKSAREAVQQLKAKKSDQAMWNRYRKGMKAEAEYDAKAFELVMRGYKQEGDGDLRGAAETWKELADGWAAKEKDEDALWGWLGQRHLKLQVSIDELESKFAKMREKAVLDEVDMKPETDNDLAAYQALRFEQFGDFTMAKAKWAKLREERAKDYTITDRPYLILSARKARELDDRKTPKDEDREKFVKDKLDLAKGNLQVENLGLQKTARQTLRDIRDLYFGEATPLAKLSDEAGKALGK